MCLARGSAKIGTKTGLIACAIKSAIMSDGIRRSAIRVVERSTRFRSSEDAPFPLRFLALFSLGPVLELN